VHVFLYEHAEPNFPSLYIEKSWSSMASPLTPVQVLPIHLSVTKDLNGTRNNISCQCQNARPVNGAIDVSITGTLRLECVPAGSGASRTRPRNRLWSIPTFTCGPHTRRTTRLIEVSSSLYSLICEAIW